MPKARAFFYVCAGVFLLALSYHLGARSAVAPGSPESSLRECSGFFAAVNGQHPYSESTRPWTHADARSWLCVDPAKPFSGGNSF